MLLNVGFLYLSRAGETGAKRMAGEGALALPFGEITADARLKHTFLHESRNMFVGKSLGGDAGVFLGYAAEQRPMRDAAKAHPGL